MLSIFLSHNHRDRTFARELAEALRSHGFKVWLDEAELQVGDSLFSKIELAIRECTYLGVILSPHSVSSPWVQREVNMALSEEIHGKKIKVLPLLKEECDIPGFLAEKLYADFTTSFESGLSVLLRRLNNDLQQETYRQERAHEVLQAGYQDWIAFSRRDNHLLDPQAIDLVIQHASQAPLSMDLLEYLFASMSIGGTRRLAPPEIDRLKKWVGSHSSNLLDNLLQHPNPELRRGTLMLFDLLGDDSVSPNVLRAIREEKHKEVRRAALRVAKNLQIPIPKSLAHELLELDPDWVVQSIALRGAADTKGCFLVSDGTEFASEIGSMAKDAGFHVVTLATSPGILRLEHLQDDLLDPYALVVIVRGEHFTQYGNVEFYDQIRRYVADGGTLFATSWVSWETKRHHMFSEVLPFRHIHDTYNEGVQVTCRPTNEGFAQELLAQPISFRTSFELLARRKGSIVLLEEQGSVPVLGYRTFGSGVCYYFNTCQHLCVGEMESPLKTNRKLADVVTKLLARVYSEVSVKSTI